MLDERLNPLGHKDYLSLQHLARYEFACQYLRPGMRVLDIACGAGYGAALMHTQGCDVTGADYDGDILSEARNIWPAITFIEADAMQLPFEDHHFDVVVSFETIEHVIAGEQLLCEMNRVLKPDGKFICSTPNIKYTAHPPYHVKEYEPEEYYQLVRSNFSQVEVFGQYFSLLDRVFDLFKWKLVPLCIRCVSFFGLKPLLKSVLGKAKSANKSESENGGTILMESNLVQSNANESKGKYQVVPIEGNNYRLLRIMIAVAQK